MSNLRDLLMDCRMALRKAVPDFQGSKLQLQLDEAVSALTRLPDTTIAGLSKAADLRDTEAFRVAAAWQAAAAALKNTQPAIFESLSKSVMARAGSMAVARTTSEMPALTDEMIAAHAAARAATAAGAKPAASTATGPATSAPIPTVVAEASGDRVEGHIPSVETLTEVAAGTRKLRDDQREWCVGEAMVVSGFALSPAELIAKGDQHIALIVLAGGRENLAE